MPQHYMMLPTAPPMDEHTMLLKRPTRMDLYEREPQAIPLLLPVAYHASRLHCDCLLPAPREERHPHEDGQRSEREPEDDDCRGNTDGREDKKAFFMFGLELSIHRLASCKIKVKLSC